MLKKMKVKYKLFLLVAIFIIGFLVFGIYSNKIMTDIKVNGKMYKQIINGKNLIADILPPPEYIVELHLTTLELLNENNKNKIEDLIKSLSLNNTDFSKSNKSTCKFNKS